MNLLTGVERTTSPEALKNPKAVRFNSAFQGSRFVLEDGATIIFAGGVYITADSSEIAQLEAACKVCGGFPISKGVVTADKAVPPAQ